MDALNQVLMIYRTSLWNKLIPNVAKNIVIGDTHTTYVHPTKGHRRVNNKRLGL